MFYLYIFSQKKTSMHSMLLSFVRQQLSTVKNASIQKHGAQGVDPLIWWIWANPKMVCSWDTQSSSSQLPPSLPGRLVNCVAGTRDVDVLTWLLLPFSAASYASWKAMTFDIRQTKRSWLSSSIWETWAPSLRSKMRRCYWGQTSWVGIGSTVSQLCDFGQVT